MVVFYIDGDDVDLIFQHGVRHEVVFHEDKLRLLADHRVVGQLHGPLFVLKTLDRDIVHVRCDEC